MYAIVECGGRQYRAEEGVYFTCEKLPYEVGDQIVLDNVLLIANGDEVTVGQPTIPGARVQATVLDLYRDKKIFVWKYKPKKRYRKRMGHRQWQMKIRVDHILADGAEAPVAVAEAAPVMADDLTKIEGIGPKIGELLQDAGIATFAALAERSAEQLNDILAAAGSRYAIAVPDSWPEQAALAAAGDWDGLAALQDRLEGGRYVDDSADDVTIE